MRPYLLIVEQPDLYEYLTRIFSRDEEVEVVLDRRVGQRRQEVQAHEPERRRGERRRQPDSGKDAVRSLGATLIRRARAALPSAPTAPRHEVPPD